MSADPNSFPDNFAFLTGKCLPMPWQHRLFDQLINGKFPAALDLPTELKPAVAKVLHASWQHCRVHFMRNALARAGKSGRRVVAAFIATAFAQEDAESASVQWRQVADQLRPKVPKLAALMDDAEADVLAFMSFPKSLPSRRRGTIGQKFTRPTRWNGSTARSRDAPRSHGSGFARPKPRKTRIARIFL